jgi:uncharacterized membrane protein YkoI
MTNKLKKVLITVVALAALALGGSALAGAAAGGDPEAGDKSSAITGDAKTRAEQAALAETGGGKVNQSELDNENGATYEVEVAKTDGTQVDVRLDDNFKVVIVEADGEKGDEGNQGADQNPDEAGHQDEKAGEQDNEPAGETADDAGR